MKAPELLLPVGSLQHMRYAFAFGADAVYAGQPRYSLRVRNNAFHKLDLLQQGIEKAVTGRAFDPRLIGQLDNLANRGYTDGFYQRHPTQEQQDYLHDYSSNLHQQYVGEVVGFYHTKQRLDIDVRNQFGIGDTLELITPSGNVSFKLQSLLDQQDQQIAKACRQW